MNKQVKQIRNEVERLIKWCNAPFTKRAGVSGDEILNNLLSFIDSLEEEPEVDLEKEVKDYIYTLPHSRTGIPGGWKCSWNEEEVIKIVKHFLEVK